MLSLLCPCCGTSTCITVGAAGVNLHRKRRKKDGGLFYFSIFLIFCYFAGSLSTEQSLCAGWQPPGCPELFQDPFPQGICSVLLDLD